MRARLFGMAAIASTRAGALSLCSRTARCTVAGGHVWCMAFHSRDWTCTKTGDSRDCEGQAIPSETNECLYDAQPHLSQSRDGSSQVAESVLVLNLKATGVSERPAERP